MAKITSTRSGLSLLLGLVACSGGPPTTGTTGTTPVPPTPTAVTATTGDTGTPFVPDPDWTLVSATSWVGDPGDLVGQSMAVGDADGDGDAEILVGRLQTENLPYCRSLDTHGAVLIDGVPPGGSVHAAARTEWSEVSTGIAPADAFGSALSLPGDLTGDTLPDVVIGIGGGDGSDANEEDDNQVLLVYSGDRIGTFDEEAAEVILTRGPPVADAWYPAPVRPCGDVDLDGAADLCTGNRIFFGPLAGTVPESDADVTFLVPGTPTQRAIADIEPYDPDGDGANGLALTVGPASVPDPSVVWFETLTSGAYDISVGDARWDVGAYVFPLSAGDLDADGLEELAVGAGTADGPGGQSSGAAFVVSGTTGGDTSSIRMRFDGRYPDDMLGTDLAIADFDADGADDLAIGIAPDTDRPSRVAVFTGPLTAGTRSESDASVIWLLSATPPTNPRGGLTLGAGDVDGDTVADLVIGNGSDEVGGADAGAVFFLPHAGL